MWRYKLMYGGGGWNFVTREEWLQAILDGLFNPKAPKEWVRQQESEEGRPPIAAYAIWAKYPLARKYTIWSLADDDDAQAAGYLVR